FFSTTGSDPTPSLHSFPTRRSSDLRVGGTKVVCLTRIMEQVIELAFTSACTDEFPISRENRALGSRKEFPVQRLIGRVRKGFAEDRKSTRLNSSHVEISYAVFCLKK